MILRLAIYVVTILIFMFGQRYHGLLSKFGFSKGSHVVVFLFVLYLFLLVWEISHNYGLKMSLSKATKRGFSFSFLIGGLWGLGGTYSSGFHYDVPYSLFVLNYIVSGVLFGLFGVVVTRMVFSRLAK